MGERTNHAPGTFSWADLSTSDLDAATPFYEGLLGWSHNDNDTGDGGIYRMFQQDGKDVAAGSAQRDEERAQGVPPHWNNYVTVESADATASRTAELGGTVIVPPFDVLEAGRMAVIADPTGAVLCVWEPRASIGAQLVNEPGTLTWNDLATTDVDVAKRFYSDLLGWSYEDVGSDEMPYATIRNGDRMNGGMRPLGDQEQQMGVPPNWMPYFVSGGIEKDAAQIADLGGQVMVGPMSILQGSKIAVARDPQGAVFALFEGETED
jgi:predicted enzyme related to lactoylglutathione lyase